MNFTLPYPPSVNAYYRTFRGRMLISERGREFRTNVMASILQNGKPEKMLGSLSVRVWLCPPDRRKRDLDNALKGLLDSLQHAGVYDNDCQIDELHVIRGPITADGEAIVMVTEL